MPEAQSVIGVTGKQRLQTVQGEKPVNTILLTCGSAEEMDMTPMIVFTTRKFLKGIERCNILIQSCLQTAGRGLLNFLTK